LLELIGTSNSKERMKQAIAIFRANEGNVKSKTQFSRAFKVKTHLLGPFYAGEPHWIKLGREAQRKSSKSQNT